MSSGTPFVVTALYAATLACLISSLSSAQQVDPYSFPIHATQPETGILTGFVIFYGHPLSPPYLVEVKDNAVLINGVQITPPRWWNRSGISAKYLEEARRDYVSRLTGDGTLLVSSQGTSGSGSNFGGKVMPIMLNGDLSPEAKVQALRASYAGFGTDAEAKEFVSHFSAADWHPRGEVKLPPSPFAMDSRYLIHPAVGQEGLRSPYPMVVAKAARAYLKAHHSAKSTADVVDLLTDERFVQDYVGRQDLAKVLAEASGRTFPVLKARAESHIQDHRHISQIINGTRLGNILVDVEDAYALPLLAYKSRDDIPLLRQALLSKSPRFRMHASEALRELDPSEEPKPSPLKSPDFSLDSFPAHYFLEFKAENPDSILDLIDSQLSKRGAKIFGKRVSYSEGDTILGDAPGRQQQYVVPRGVLDQSARDLMEVGVLNRSRSTTCSLSDLDGRIERLREQIKKDGVALGEAGQPLRFTLAGYQIVRSELAKHQQEGLIEIRVLKVR